MELKHVEDRSDGAENSPPFSINADNHSEEPQVGHFELRLLAVISSERDRAFGSNIQRVLSEMIGRDVAVGQLYLALSRLEQKGFISSQRSSPEPRKGGRSKKVFQLEAPGVRALDRTATVLNASGAFRVTTESPYEGEAVPT